MKWVVPYNSSLGHRALFDDFDRLVNSFLTPLDAQTVNFKPACDIDETADHYLASFDLPGVKKEDISIEIKDGYLTVTGERHRETKDTKAQHYERSYGKFQRRFSLPEKIDPKQIEAAFEDGVLQLLIPKTKEAEGHKIEIKSKASGGLLDKILNVKSSKEE
ncbi:MAG: Hsp20/alpha crystallin family protein [Bdellovibrionaceae bacterium]|nr:Hsp20/alpha crystallin family protein [Pseudobdellovibrionaceae bacterium]